MKISNEVKVKIFSAYIGSPVQYSAKGRNGYLRGIANNNLGEINCHIHPNQTGTCNYCTRIEISLCHLILKPLNQISDEDAIEVAKIAMKSPELMNDDVSIDEVDAENIVRQNEKTSIDITCRCFIGWVYIFNQFLKIMIQGENGTDIVPTNNMSQCVDYLRSKSYDCGYGSTPSLIEAKIALSF